MQDLSADITVYQKGCETPNKDKSCFDSSSSTFQHQQNYFNSTRTFLSQQCPKANQNTPDPNSRSTIYNNYSDEQEASVESKDDWPEIKQIVNKICKLQSSLENQKKRNKELVGLLKLNDIKKKSNAQEIKLYLQQAKKNSQNYKILQEQLIHQHENMKLKDEQLAKSKQTFSEIQMNLLKRIGDMQQKLRKVNNQTKQLTQKLRRSNSQLQKQRSFNRQLKRQMTNKIENMQSSKQIYLSQQIQNLKSIINSTQDEKQCKYLQQIEVLNRKIYQCEEELKSYNIQMNLMERKKQQAVKQVCDKKDQEIKVQKTMLKSLNEKLTKMHEDFKKFKKENSELPKNKRLNAAQKKDEEFLLELSPEKY